MFSKRYLARTMTFAVMLALTACVTDSVRSGAGGAFKKGDYLGAFRALKADLASPGDARRRAVRQFDVSSDGREGLVASFSDAIRKVDGLTQFAQLSTELTLADASGLLTSEQANELRHLLQLTLSRKVVDGTVFFEFGEVGDGYPALNATTEAERRIIENTLQVIESSLPGSPGVRRAPVTALFQFLVASGADHRGLVESALSRVHFSIRELKFDVYPVFPVYAEQRLGELVTDVAVVASTRLLEVDVGSILAQRDELAITDDDKTAEAVVEIAELQYRERQIGPIQRPVRILPQNITPLLRPVSVPEGSAFIYDLVESTFDVEWAYETRIVRDGAMQAHDVIRGVETRTDHQCHNGRYVTTSGQEIPSSEWPAADVALSCRGSGPPAPSGLQPAIMKKLGERVLMRLLNDGPVVGYARP